MILVNFSFTFLTWKWNVFAVFLPCPIMNVITISILASWHRNVAQSTVLGKCSLRVQLVWLWNQSSLNDDRISHDPKYMKLHNNSHTFRLSHWFQVKYTFNDQIKAPCCEKFDSNLSTVHYIHYGNLTIVYWSDTGNTFTLHANSQALGPWLMPKWKKPQNISLGRKYNPSLLKTTLVIPCGNMQSNSLKDVFQT